MPRSESCTIPFHPEHFEELTTVNKAELNNISQCPGTRLTNWLVLGQGVLENCFFKQDVMVYVKGKAVM